MPSTAIYRTTSFATEQLAGDLLPNATLEQRIATGFNRNHRTTGEGGIIPEEYRVEYVADRAQTTATVFMGLTLGCARCHDHKYDPLSQKEFYQFFAYFNRIPDEKGFTWNYGNEDPLVKAPLPEQVRKLAELDRKVADAQARFDALRGGMNWAFPEGLLFRSGPAQHFDGTALRRGRRQDCGLRLPTAFHHGGMDRAREPERSDRVSCGGLFRGHGTRALPGGWQNPAAHPPALYGSRDSRGIRRPRRAAGSVSTCWSTYDGGHKAAGVQIYLNGQPVAMKILFDQNLEPIHHPKTPLRIGAGGGLRFTGTLEDVRIYDRPLDAAEAAVIASGNEREAPAEIRRAHEELLAVRRERKEFDGNIPSVMVMADSPSPRDTFLLKRGAYDAPGEKVTAGLPASARHAARRVVEGSPGAGPLAGGPHQSADRACGRESLLAVLFRRRHRQDGG